jgi:hypothetical protein
MPKNTVNDPITDQEMAYAHLLMSGTMNDRRAAEAVGLNPDTAAYIKSKPRVRAYMLEHRAAVREKLVDQEADGLRKLNLGRDQILARLWELANLSSEATRGSITGQVKALTMIVALEGLIPSGTKNAHRLFQTQNQPAAPPATAQIYVSEWRRSQQRQPEGTEEGDVVAATKVQADAGRPRDPEPPPQPTPKPANNALSPNLDRNHLSVINPFINPPKTNWVPDATGSMFDVALDATNSRRLPFSRK